MRLGQFSDYLSKNSCIFVSKLRRFDERVTETGREFQITGTLVENCKLLEICTAQMRSIIAACSGIIVINLAIRYKKIEKQWRQEVISIMKHEIGDFKRIDLENI